MDNSLMAPSKFAIMERVVLAGDLAQLSAADRVQYYNRVCESLGLNPFTRPFEYITLNNKLTLYARRDAADQLRKIHQISVTIKARERMDDLYVVTAHAQTPDGRTDESTGVVTLGRKSGDDLANALMKAETKAKRRVTLSIVGLGWLDETEVESIHDARPVTVNQDGEIVSGGNGAAEPTHEQSTHDPAVVLSSPPPINALAAFDDLKAKFQQAQNGHAVPAVALDKARQTVAIKLGKTAIGNDDELRHALTQELFGAAGLTALDAWQLAAFRDWLDLAAAKTWIAEWVQSQLQGATI